MPFCLDLVYSCYFRVLGWNEFLGYKRQHRSTPRAAPGSVSTRIYPSSFPTTFNQSLEGQCSSVDLSQPSSYPPTKWGGSTSSACLSLFYWVFWFFFVSVQQDWVECKNIDIMVTFPDIHQSSKCIMHLKSYREHYNIIYAVWYTFGPALQQQFTGVIMWRTEQHFVHVYAPGMHIYPPSTH